MNKNKVILIFLLITILFSGLYAQDKQLKVLVSVFKPEGFHNAFWDALQMGARKAAKDNNVYLEYKGIPKEFGDDRVKGQTSVIQTYSTKGFDAIVFTPCDRVRMVSAVKYAVVRNVKVVAVDSPVETSLLSSILSTNNYEGSMNASKYMAKLLKGKGNVIMLAHPARDNKATRDRELAFIDGMKRFAPNVKLLSTDQYGGATVDTDYAAAKKLLKMYPEVNGIYCVSGTAITGFLMALEEINKAGSVYLIGWDSDKRALEGLKNGSVHAIVQQNPEKMGYMGVNAAVSAIHGKEIKKIVDTGVILVTKENMNTKSVKQLISPNFEGWIK